MASKNAKHEKLIIAEIGSVHDGSFGNACKLIEIASKCGANAVKFQTHIAESETLIDAPMPPYFSGEPRYEYFKRTSFTIEQWRGLLESCKANNVLFVSSPFSLEAVDLLENVGISIYKIPSGENTNIPLLEKIAKTAKPVLLSSGMSNWKELDNAVKVLSHGEHVVIMQCSSTYPCPPEKVGLNVLGEMNSRYGLSVGFSDHTIGMAAGFAAAALGAVVIEKHFTFSRYMYGSDAANSMEPDDFASYCHGVKEIWTMLGNPVDKNDLTSYKEMKNIFEKSVVAAMPISAGTKIEFRHLAFKKPGNGISASEYTSIVGRLTKKAVLKDHLFKWNDFT